MGESETTADGFAEAEEEERGEGIDVWEGRGRCIYRLKGRGPRRDDVVYRMV